MNFKPIYLSTLLVLLAASPVAGFNAAAEPGQSTAAENFTATGTVVDQNGDPVIGAAVIESGKSSGVNTDIDGRFSIVVPRGAKITVTFVGCKPVTVEAAQNMQITLEEEANALDEVVVVGFGTQKKLNLTGAVGLATAEDIQSRPVKNLSEALQGLVPGMQMTRNSGDIETNMSIQIRGVGTIGDGSSGNPLVLIDGMEGDINTVNPQDVESISVLKDAASSSIYGSRAAFGVVLITTKKGSEGKVNVTYNNSFRWASPIGIPEAMNSIDFMLYYNNGYENTGWGAFFPEQTILNAIEFQKKGGTNGKYNTGALPTDGNVWGKPAGDPFTAAYANTDWYHEIYKDNAFSQEHNAAVSGGNNTVTYYASLGYLDYNGMLRHGHDGQKRYNATGKFSAKLAPWITLNYSARFVRTDLERPSRFGNGFYEMIGRQTWPNLPVYDENGYYFNSNADTPAMQLALGGTRESQRDELYQQGSLVMEPIKNWTVHVEFNYSIDNSDVRSVSLPRYNHKVDGSIDNTNGTTSLSNSNTRNNYMNWNIFTDYTLNLADTHNFKVMAGMQSEEMRQKYLYAYAVGLQDENLPELDLVTGLRGDGKSEPPSVRGYRNQWSILGVFGRINYDYKGKYLFEGNIRYDGSSRFRAGKRWTWAPSASLGWRISEEEFMKDTRSWLNNLKLRLSYGTLANQNTNAWYPTYRTMTISQNSGSWLQNGARPNTSWVNGLVSSSLTWEKVRTWNAALDWGLFNNRLNGSFDYYIRFTDDMVGPAVQYPATLGLAAPKANNCDLRTNGWELQLSWKDNTSFGLSYGITASLSDAKTVIRKYPGNTTNSIWNYVAGREIGEIWGYETVGIAKSDAEMNEHLATADQSALGENWAEGDIMYRDLNNDGVVNSGAETVGDHGDLKVIGNRTPRYFYGIDLTASYKGFDIRAFFQGVGKRDYDNGSPTFWGLTGNVWWSAAMAEHLDYYRANDITVGDYTLKANRDSYYPRALANGRNQQTQTRYLQDASYIRLKNLQVGYTLPANLTRQFYVQNLRLFVSVDNLWTHTNLSKLFDPERIDGGYNGYGNSYPLARTWAVGLSVTL